MFVQNKSVLTEFFLGKLSLTTFYLIKFWIKKDENTILVPTFWCNSQFGPYILVAVNLINIIFNLQLI